MSNFNLMLLSLSLLGLANASFLYFQYNRFKKTGQKMYCLMKEDCAGVIGSKYGTTLGLKNEIGGISFYMIVSVYSLFGNFITHFKNLIVLITFLAFVFSLYLLFLQIFVLKKFCSWCLIAILINFLIFVTIFIQ